MTGMAIYPDGRKAPLSGRTTAEILAAADRLGARSVRIAVDGGVLRLIRLSGEWIVL